MNSEFKTCLARFFEHTNIQADFQAKIELLANALGVRIYLAGILVDVLVLWNQKLLRYYFFLGCELDAETHF